MKKYSVMINFVNYYSLDKTALTEAVSLTDDMTISESEIGIYIVDTSVTDPYSCFIKGSAMLVGSRHLDMRCTGVRSYYAMPENFEKAKEAFAELKKQNLKRNANYPVWL